MSQGDAVNVRILEIDGERRRLSLSLKRVEEGDVPVPRADGAESVHTTPDLRLSEEAFPTTSAAVSLADEDVAEAETGEEADEAEEIEEVVAEVVVDEAEAEEIEEVVAEVEVDEAEAEALAEEVVAEVELDEVEPEAEPSEDPVAETALEVGSEQPDAD